MFILVNTIGMILIPEDIHPNVVDALRELQSREVSINRMAEKLGVKPNWLHLLKNKGVGAETLRKVILLHNHLVKNHPDLMNSASDTRADTAAPIGNNHAKTAANADRSGAVVALSGSGADSSSGAFNSSAGQGMV